MPGGSSPYEQKVAQVAELAGALLAIYDAADHSDAGLYNVVRQTEHDPRFGRPLLETLSTAA